MALVDNARPFDAERLAQRVKLSGYGLQLTNDLTETEAVVRARHDLRIADRGAGRAWRRSCRALKLLSEASGRDLFESDASSSGWGCWYGRFGDAGGEVRRRGGESSVYGQWQGHEYPGEKVR